VTRPVPITLEAAGVRTYAELFDLPTEEVIRRLDEGGVPLHPGDAFLALLVLRGVAGLRDSAERLDTAGRRFEIAGLVLALVAVTVAVAELARAVL
jgi:hypothetical protein